MKYVKKLFKEICPIKKLGMMGAFFLISQCVFAGFHLEPYINYRVMGDGSSSTSGIESDYDYNGVLPGARVGYSMFNVSLGVDYSFSSFDLEVETTGSVVGSSSEEQKKKILVPFSGLSCRFWPEFGQLIFLKLKWKTKMVQMWGTPWRVMGLA